MIRKRSYRSTFSVGMRGLMCLAAAAGALVSAGCSQIEEPKVEPFYAVPVPPPQQELRWSNGSAPRSFDPARASAAPDTDIVRAAYEGLTELDSRTLRAVPAVALRWEASEDLRKWTFYLREDAKWSNGEAVTAEDFVRSWQRLSQIDAASGNRYLFSNIVGMRGGLDKKDPASGDSSPKSAPSTPNSGTKRSGYDVQYPFAQMAMPRRPHHDQPARPGQTPDPQPDTTAADSPEKFGVTASDEFTLQIELYRPDKDFAKLVASPIFRPVYGDGKNFDSTPLDVRAPTNGAFRIEKIEDGSVTLIKSDHYWNKSSIALERVRFVPFASAEQALEAYRNGNVDIVTNAAFEPVAVKVLTPFEDFRRTAHNALNFYEINVDRPPFNDRRVRHALALAIDREKLTEGDLQGTTQPAYSFSPLRMRRDDSLSLDVKKAQDLLDKAGYPNGYGFPPVRLVINRNDIQQRVAGSVVRMWKQNLNLEAEIVVKEPSEMEDVRRTGDYDLLRRGVVLPTNNELVGLTAVHGEPRPTPQGETQPVTPRTDAAGRSSAESLPESNTASSVLPGIEDEDMIEAFRELTDDTETALFELRAIPLYFPTSYSLIKPYVIGFELNSLDAPSLNEVSIDNDWQLKKAVRES